MDFGSVLIKGIKSVLDKQLVCLCEKVSDTIFVLNAIMHEH